MTRRRGRSADAPGSPAGADFRTRRCAKRRLGAVAATLALLSAVPPVGAQTLRGAIATTMEIPDHPRVLYYAARYSSTGTRAWLRSVAQRAGFYARYILGLLDERDMPAELLFLPAIESGFVSNAVSPAGAVGLWQLMLSTARPHGLVTDEVVDERRDFWKATDVALRILQYNYDLLGSWELALAAYNAGLGRVQRSVRQGGSSDFWELRRRGLLPRETREFVPRYFGLLVALRRMPAAEWPRMDTLPRWRRMAAPHGVEMRQLGYLAGLPPGVLERANAELRYGLTPSRDRGSHRIKVPAAFYNRITEVIASGTDLIRFHRHIVRTGDTISELAEAYEVSVGLIREYNAGVNPRRLPVGLALHIPLVSGVDPAALTSADELPRDLRVYAGRYEVTEGDSLWSIARRHDTTVEALASANDLQASSILHPGQVLRVPYRWAPPAFVGVA